MSANSLSHLLHANAGSEAHRLPTGTETNYAITAPTAPPVPPIQSQQPVPVGHMVNPYNAVPPPPTLPPTSAPQPQTNTTPQHSHAQNATTSSPGLQTPAGRSHSLTQSLYQCADCQRRYSRPEHLARHIQTQSVSYHVATCDPYVFLSAASPMLTQCSLYMLLSTREYGKLTSFCV